MEFRLVLFRSGANLAELDCHRIIWARSCPLESCKCRISVRRCARTWRVPDGCVVYGIASPVPSPHIEAESRHRMALKQLQELKGVSMAQPTLCASSAPTRSTHIPKKADQPRHKLQD